MEIILEFIAYFFIEIVFEKVILGFFRLIKKLGIWVIKIVLFSQTPIEHFQEKYKDYSIPYFIGFSIIGVIFYLIF